MIRTARSYKINRPAIVWTALPEIVTLSGFTLVVAWMRDGLPISSPCENESVCGASIRSSIFLLENTKWTLIWFRLKAQYHEMFTASFIACDLVIRFKGFISSYPLRDHVQNILPLYFDKLWAGLCSPLPILLFFCVALSPWNLSQNFFNSRVPSY